jgi:multidrug efflux pump subunit AcrA (membrane-fusion protein)
MKSAFLAAGLVLLMGCRRTEAPGESAKAQLTPDAPTPVKVARAAQRSLDDVVTGPGHTAAQSQQKVRAPFAGTLLDLRVSDGDVVRRGQAIGAIVSRESEAALSGAREMLREAHSPAEREDAERAVALAEQNLVRKPILATADGPILSHVAASGDRLAEDQEILTIADASSIVFLADLPQNDLPRVRSGQRAAVDLGGGRRPLSGSVHSVLPGANTADFTGPVRIDLPRSAEQLALGLFGMARITVAHRDNATVVPDAAVLRDDVSGTSRVASVENGRVHWFPVTPGLRQDGVTEISGAPLPPGASVIVAGMVGLPEGKTVAVQP